jgi:hypothetical protein
MEKAGCQCNDAQPRPEAAKPPKYKVLRALPSRVCRYRGADRHHLEEGIALELLRCGD